MSTPVSSTQTLKPPASIPSSNAATEPTLLTPQSITSLSSPGLGGAGAGTGSGPLHDHQFLILSLNIFISLIEFAVSLLNGLYVDIMFFTPLFILWTHYVFVGQVNVKNLL